MKLAIIDLGTNSVRFDLYEVVVKEQLVKTARLHRAKEMVRLGDQVFIDRRITSEAIERTISAFERFRNVTQKHGTDQVIAFGTCALRDAKNRKDLLDQLEDRTGFKVEVISGDQEAELIALGVLENENLPDDPFMLVDIGGGSTELTLCHGKEIVNSESLNLGANRLNQIFLKKSPPEPDSLNLLRENVRETLQKNFSGTTVKNIVGSSGTIRTIRRVLRKSDLPVDPFRPKSLERLVRRMAKMDRSELKTIPGLEPKRIDLILSGSVLLDEIVKFFGCKKIFVTEFTLRDGVLAAQINDLKKQLK